MSELILYKSKDAFYNLDAIISVGYRVNSKRGPAFHRFADKNGLLRDREGGKRIADNALVAMTLMIAESRPQEKAIITAMLTNLIGHNK